MPPAQTADTALAPPDALCWQQAMAQLAATLQARGVHPAEAVVLLPYAQLIQQARHAWAAQAGATFFVPRFETTMNWASGLGGTLGLFAPSGDDLRMDMAVDMLTAASLLARAGLANQQDALAGRLVEAAWSLAGVAAAVPPARRPAWSERLALTLGAGLDSPVLALEAAVGRIALAWAATSAYPTDRLYQAKPLLFAVLEGFQADPLTESLKAHFGELSVSIPLSIPFDANPQAPALHAAQDAEDEAGRAAACVLAHLLQGRSPVALIAQDRQLTRRVGAMLAERGIAMRDETGWKLSTTRAAASLMSLLRAMPWDASTDSVLDWLKNAPAFDSAMLTTAETELRRVGVRAWRDLPDFPEEGIVPPAFAATGPLAREVNALRTPFGRARPLAMWLRDLRAALQSAGQWDALAQDEAGQTVLDVLRLHEGAETEFEASPVMRLHDFTQWANQALEGGKFSPLHPPAEQVVILPLPQLLGRPMQAVVLPGCDEIRLPVSPEPTGPWTPGQRELLGLPSREALAAAQRQAWHYALRMPHVDVLWRTSESGEHLIPSGFVQELLLAQDDAAQETPVAADPRVLRAIDIQPTPHPFPTGEALPVTRLSASAYEDLRRCPYRFFALRQLKLQEPEELESELGKRDFGNWLHSLLQHFHDALHAAPTQDPQARLALINAAADTATHELALSESEFLPFAAAWPGVREGYLEWLAGHEATGATFEAGEAWREVPLGGITLLGKLDRIDRQADGHALLIDYKTEPRSTTAERIKNGQEDTQLAFYAALMTDDTLAAAYVNLGEKEPTRTYEQPDIVGLRDELIDSILTDMARIARGAALPALGEGQACVYCAARGLCRKDFWALDEESAEGAGR
ncbi:ATP-dependent helicase/nuclease subunit B [Polaromonas sp. YR568]|uniref:PD-(D/E)XK nuclease family protein n=1 Tax=Polaromonas sp. YR568 TaxID=1855301 RepID=UPI0008E12FF4|nr:PD-(D/E)XK nuclease family protein [Polaromonas sp. YR568]SFU31572.1 ATP-dependent helicase/nuclease subunit B [Polaromonas sp. YR568]